MGAHILSGSGSPGNKVSRGAHVVGGYGLPCDEVQELTLQ
jgi:hypothetical protein